MFKVMFKIIRSRAFDRDVLMKVGGTTLFTGIYYGINGPFVSYTWSMYGFKNVSTWLVPSYELPAGITGGRPVVTENLQKLIDETRREIRLSPEAEKNVEFRTAPTPVPMHLGSGRLHRAIAILPDYINITTVTALRSNTLNDYLEYCYGWKVEDPADWLSGVAKLLLDSFVLSERAKKFLIARQAFMADSTSLGLFTTVFALCTYCFYFLVELLNKQMIRSGRSGAIVNFSIFLASGGLTFGNYHLMQYFHLKKLHEDADAKAISKGKYDSRQYEEARRMGQPLPVDPDYYEGAMEYYSKEIQRNRALRHLIRKRAGWFRDPSRQFTEDGDYQSWIFSTDPLSSRSLRAIVSWKLGSQRISD